MAKLYFYYSAMNAGKTTTLLQAAYNYEEQGMKVLLFTPKIDDRAGVGVISSRIGLKRDAFAFEQNFDLLTHVYEQQLEQKISCVFIDEAQFLTDKQVMQTTMICDRLNIPVLCYGLRSDFRGEPFEGSKYLMAWADELGEIKTICRSGKKATMNARMDADGKRVWEGEQIGIGMNYVAMSRKEFQLEKVSPVEYELPVSQLSPPESYPNSGRSSKSSAPLDSPSD